MRPMELALLSFGEEVVVSESLEDLSYMMDMLREGWGVDQDVINVHYYNHVPKDSIPKPETATSWNLH